MKKRYIHPTTEVITFRSCQPMLSGSLPLSETDTDVQFSRKDDFDDLFEDDFSSMFNDN